MTSTDLHPDDLMDREMRGELSPSEHERLESHLRQCAVCRLERLVREDFRREAEDPASEGDARRLVASLLLPATMQSALRRPARSRLRYLRMVLVSAAVVSVAGWAAAGLWSGPRAPSRDATPAAPPEAPAGLADHVAHVVRLAPPPAAASARAAAAPSAAVFSAFLVEPSAAATRRPARRPLETPSVATRAAPPPETAPVTQAPPTPDAAMLFARATAARRLGDHSGATHYFRALLEGFPASPEAQEGLAVLGRMLLDDSDADGALRCFDQYLRRGGPSREDVMLGRALSLRRLGRSSEETRAWKDLVADYPSSVHAERARRRLLDLETH